MFVMPRCADIKKSRESKGMTQHQLSCAADLPGNALFRIENGGCKKTSHLRAQAIADALGCKVKDLFDVPGESHDSH